MLPATGYCLSRLIIIGQYAALQPTPESSVSWNFVYEYGPDGILEG